jgi:hypothetical protein
MENPPPFFPEWCSIGLSGHTLTFHALGPGKIVGNDINSSWTRCSHCRVDRLKGQKLDRLFPQPGLWFA